MFGGFKKVISFDGLRMMIADLRAKGHRPAAILVSEHDKRDLKREIIERSKGHMPDAEQDDHDKKAIGFVQGIPVLSHKDVPRGKARIIDRMNLNDRNRDHHVK